MVQKVGQRDFSWHHPRLLALHILRPGLIASIPLLGLAGGGEIAIILILLERLGKTLRSPSRDTVLPINEQRHGSEQNLRNP